MLPYTTRNSPCGIYPPDIIVTEAKLDGFVWNQESHTRVDYISFNGIPYLLPPTSKWQSWPQKTLHLDI